MLLMKLRTMVLCWSNWFWFLRLFLSVESKRLKPLEEEEEDEVDDDISQVVSDLSQTGEGSVQMRTDGEHLSLVMCVVVFTKLQLTSHTYVHTYIRL